MDIAGWLRSLGLEQYEPAFRENHVDETVLPNLTAEDVKDLGVGSIGHRRKLLEAIALLRDAADAKGPPPDASSTQLGTPPASEGAIPSTGGDAVGERRYLTVMFCDLVGSTGISAQLDAEEWRDLVGSYLDAASAAVTEMGGQVAKKLGDGLMALFGYPLAQENDAERAVRAALAIQRALAELNRKNASTGKPELIARIGLDTGPAVVDATGEIYGDVANVAARVQALAEPGAVLATARVQRQVAGLFVAEEHGSHVLKGVPEPVALYRLIRASGGGRRSGQRQLTPLVGRDEEMAMLMRRWDRARQGDGQFVLIVGEPGLGKSRLLEEFHSRLRDTPHTWTEWSFLQLLQNTPLHSIAEWGRQRFGGADVPAERRLADLESSLSLVKLDPGENIPLLAPLLDIPLPQDRAPTLTAEELRRRQLAALTDWSLASARIQPLVLALEDLHWADPTSLELLRGIAERGALAPLLVVATTRPEFRPAWGVRSHHVTISLAPLDRQQVREMVAELSARHALAKEVVEDVAARTGGVPLFIEEVTRLLLERGEQGGIQAIPPTLQQSLMARLDRLGPAREVAQIGSVIGRGFSYSLLRDVAGLEDAGLQAALEKLAEADIVLVQGLPPGSDYRFKHALIQDAAYENLLKSRRQVLHRRVAEMLRARFADTVAGEPEALAHHFTQAGMTDDAIEWWGKAGDQALRRSAFQEAIAHLGKAIEMADQAGDSPAPGAAAATTTSATERLKLQTSYGRALAWSRGFAAEDTKAAFSRARELAAGVENVDERFDAYYGLWVGSIVGGDLELALATAETCRRDAESSGRRTDMAVAHRYLGLTYLSRGQFTEARTNLEQALRIYDVERDREANLRYGVDTGAGARIYLALADWHLGDFARVGGLINDALALALETRHPPTSSGVCAFQVLFEIFCGNAEAALKNAETLVNLSREHSIVLAANGVLNAAWARAKLGDREAGVTELKGALRELIATGTKLYLPLYQGLLAEIEAQTDDSEQAMAVIGDALAFAGDTGEHWSDAFLHRVRGEILLKRDPANTLPAERSFLTAISIAKQQKARSFELRAALSLAKLYRSTRRSADAHAVLTSALEGFAPTPYLPQIEEAQALLAILADTDEVREVVAARERRLKLQTAYGMAVAWSRGFAADETKAAFARVHALSTGADNSDERYTGLYGQWVASLQRAELDLARETAETFLREAVKAARMPETAAALRYLGLTCLCQGHFVEARAHLEEVLRIYDPSRDRDASFRFGTDSLASATIYLAIVCWQFGEFVRARELSNEAIAWAIETGHAATIANTWAFKALFEMTRGDAEATLRAAQALVELSQRLGLPNYLALGGAYSGWARARLGDPETGIPELRQGLTAYIGLGNKLGIPPYHARLAEIEAAMGNAEAALVRIDQALALANETQHQHLALLHRIRGEILLKLGRTNTKSAEESFLAAIGIARQQEARTDQLLAALALAKLYRATRRNADARAVLVPALEGFTPTLELPQIEEAQSLLARLAQADEVKSSAAARERRLKLQTDYGLAVAWSKGFAAEETKAAFARAEELSAGSDNLDQRFTSLYGQWITSLVRGELGTARDVAETFRYEAENAARMPETVAALRYLGLTCLCQGHFVEARTHLEEVLRIYDPGRDREANFRFGTDSLASATIYLAQAYWHLGDFRRARELSDEAIARAVESAHDASLAHTWSFKAVFEMSRGDAQATSRAAQAVIELSQRLRLPNYLAQGRIFSAWALTQLGAGEAAIDELRQALTEYIGLGNKLRIPFVQGKLAEVEARAENAETALVRIDEALALANETGQHQDSAILQCIRGEILLKLDPAKTKPAEESFLSAIAIAQQQGARTDRLHAALALAKLYRASGRPGDARVVLTPALQGFTPTPELPEIGKARALLEGLSSEAIRR